MKIVENVRPNYLNHFKSHCRSILIVSVLITALLIISCGKKEEAAARNKAATRSAPKFPVEVSTVQVRDAEFSVSAVGSVEAFEIVQVTARVTGAVQKVLFKEGDVVKAGNSMAEIQPYRYQWAVQSAEAALEKAKAARRESQAGLTRRLDIQKKNPGYVSLEDLEDWRTRALSAEADSSKAAADLELARLNLRDSYVPAPVSGIIQTRSIQTGQFMQSGTVIATLVRRDPLLLRFTVPELDAARIRKNMKVTFRVRGDDKNYQARVTAVSESADPSTRLVRITAEVNDPDRENLRPGSFAEVTVNLGERTELPVIPQTAIRPSEKGFLAFVIEDSTARERVLALGSRSPDGFVEVRSGISSGEQVVVRGAEALRDGAAVRIMPPEKTADTSIAGTGS